jgi:hypothetical protein
VPQWVRRTLTRATRRHSISPSFFCSCVCCLPLENHRLHDPLETSTLEGGLLLVARGDRCVGAWAESGTSGLEVSPRGVLSTNQEMMASSNVSGSSRSCLHVYMYTTLHISTVN